MSGFRTDLSVQRFVQITCETVSRDGGNPKHIAKAAIVVLEHCRHVKSREGHNYAVAYETIATIASASVLVDVRFIHAIFL